MRMMLWIQIDALSGSRSLQDGTMQKTLHTFAEKFRPEATYFALNDGARSGFFVFDMQSSRQILEVTKGFFDLGFSVVIAPCMTAEELRAGHAAVGLS